MEYQAFSELYGRYLDTSSISRKKLDLVYGPHPRNRLDIYYPEMGTGPWPVVVFFHGGGFFKGDKGRYQLRPALSGLERGYAVVSVNYRLAPSDPLPGAYQDARMAVQYLTAKAGTLDLDPERMALWGESAGATLACYTALAQRDRLPDDPQAPYPDQDFSIRAVVDWYTRFGRAAIEDTGLPLPGVTGLESAQKYLYGVSGEALSPILEMLDLSAVMADRVPPVLIQHGTADELVPPENSLALREALLKRLPEEQVPLVLVEGAKHGVADFEHADNLDLVFGFLDQHLKTG